MSALLALANETLLDIIEDVRPDDILNFALSCKRMLALSQECLELHGRRSKTYASVKFHGCPRHDNDSHPLALLRDIFNDWRIAFYPRSMTIQCCDCRGRFVSYNEHKEAREESDDDGDDDDADDEEVEEVEDFADTEPLDRVIKGFERDVMKKINMTDHPRHQVSKVKEWGIGKRGAMLGLLLTMLPNLEDLTLAKYTWGANTFRTVLWNIVEANLDPDYTGSALLTKLKKVVVFDFVSNRYQDAEVFGCFAFLPSMEVLYGNVASTWGTGEDDTDYRWPRRADQTSAVSAIKFEHSEISFGYFSQLLRGITRLREFTYEFVGGYNTSDPYRLIDILLLYSKTTLEHLEIKGFACEQFKSEDGAGNGSLRDFEVLKDIHVHARLWANGDEDSTGAMDPEEDYEAEGGAFIPLVDTLPSCIETVQLEGAFHMRDVDHLLTCLTGPKGRRLRNLRKVVFQDVESSSDIWEEVARAWKECCAVVGVGLEFEWDILSL